jgi:hypothetical protein
MGLSLPWTRFFSRKRPAQHTFCYCPGCHENLVSRVDVDGTTVTDTDLVRYQCSCGVDSVWNFDLPVPILLGRLI